jgi:hypothetical protein
MGIAIFTAARAVQAVPAWFELHWPQRQRAAATTARATASGTGGPIAAGVRGHPLRTQRLPHPAGHGVVQLTRRLLGRLAGTARRGDRMPAERGPHWAGQAKPLRVLRVIEPHQARNAAGRMVISGRMADVCAELDRLAAAEAACGFDQR